MGKRLVAEERRERVPRGIYAFDGLQADLSADAEDHPRRDAEVWFEAEARKLGRVRWGSTKTRYANSVGLLVGTGGISTVLARTPLAMVVIGILVVAGLVALVILAKRNERNNQRSSGSGQGGAFPAQPVRHEVGEGPARPPP